MAFQGLSFGRVNESPAEASMTHSCRQIYLEGQLVYHYHYVVTFWGTKTFVSLRRATVPHVDSELLRYLFISSSYVPFD